MGAKSSIIGKVCGGAIGTAIVANAAPSAGV